MCPNHRLYKNRTYSRGGLAEAARRFRSPSDRKRLWPIFCGEQQRSLGKPKGIWGVSSSNEVGNVVKWAQPTYGSICLLSTKCEPCSSLLCTTMPRCIYGNTMHSQHHPHHAGKKRVRLMQPGSARRPLANIPPASGVNAARPCASAIATRTRYLF